MKAYLTKISLLIISVFLSTVIFAQGLPGDTNPWSDVTESVIQKAGQTRHIIPAKYRTLQMDPVKMVQILDQAPERFKGSQKEVLLSLPMPDEGFQTYRIWYAPIMHPDLAAKYPNIRSFVGQGVEDPTAVVRFDLTPKGFHAMIRSGNQQPVFIDPFAAETNLDYISYFKTDFAKPEASEFICEFDEHNKEALKTIPDIDEIALKTNGDCDLRTYRLALACTGEYAQFHGGTVAGALAAMNTTMTRVNGIFETDITTTLQLVPNTDQLIFLNGNSDPYSNGNGGAMLGQNISTCNSVIGSSNYDIGHVFSTGGGGVAYLQCVCGSNKAGGVTGQGTPVGDPFDVDYVAHEMGHQFGGRHTQNNNCNRDSQSSYEPGSASTIMGYAGICSPNVQSNSDDFFHINSVILMSNFTNGGGNSCAMITNTGNNAPSANAGNNHIIPKSTPFVLEGSATDPDGDALTYCWEQYDKQVASMPPQSSNTTGPAFRSLDPTASPDRYLPKLTDIIANNSPTWEVLASVSRTYNWRLTVRDNNPGAGCTDDDEITVTVDGSSGPFLVTSPNNPVVWNAGNSETITWDVAGTSGGSVNAANVDIFLSTDGGMTYPITLATATPNDGSHTITVPNNATTDARVMVRGSGNIFFDISNQDFTIIGAPLDFTLTVTPPSVTLCQGEIATYTVNIGSVGGFNGPVSLSAVGLPAGANAVFSTNPVNAPGSSNLIITNTQAIAPGSYTFDIEGTGTPGTETQTVGLVVQPGAPGSTLPLTPADDAVDVSLNPLFSWAPTPNADDYELTVADNPNLNNPIIQVTVPSTSYAPAAPLEEGVTYYWQVRADNNCGNGIPSTIFSFTTLVTNPPLEVSVSGTDVSCNNGSDGTATALASGGTGSYSYSWDNGGNTATITGLAAGTYTVSVSDGVELVTDMITINEPTAISISGTVTDDSGASDGAIDITVSGGTPDYMFSWSSGQNTEDITGLAAGTYTVSVTDDNGCTASESFVVESTQPPLSVSVSGTDVSCNNGSDGTATALASGGTGSYTYSWDNGGNTATITGLAAGTYTVSVFDGAELVTDMITINEPTAISISGTVTDDSGASDGTIDITVSGGTPGYTFAWSNGETSEDIDGLEAGTYSVDVTDANGCTASETFVVESANTDCLAWVPESIETTGTTATIYWNINPIHIAYRIRYRVAGSSDPWESPSFAADLGSYTISDLSPNTTYEYQTITKCSNGEVSDWSAELYEFTTVEMQETCESWVADQITTTSTTAIISWLPEPGATSYRLAYRPVTGGPWTRIQTTMTNVVLNNLQPNTVYTYMTRTLCPLGGWTPWSEEYEFTTELMFNFEVYDNNLVEENSISLRPNPVTYELEVAINMESARQVFIRDYTGKVVNSLYVDSMVQTINVSDLPAGIYFLSVQAADGSILTERFVKAD
ncbi:MAG: T9SS type A sorting domain-containing protein [Bacteroidetes bacterium]|nr:T9SS type A sorting domain-containing protein [Bacteroidota bacterium]